jgi:tetratricopeptide (TPR) repeat protein
LAVVVGFLLWRRHAYVTVDLRDAEARRRSAAEWMTAGESAAAEEMLRAAVTTLEGWPKALAHGDLASLLVALDREAEAIAELQLACELGKGNLAEQGEALELRIRLARLLAKAGDEAGAEQLLLAPEEPGEEPVFGALRSEALAEFYLDEGRAPEALSLLGPALAVLVEHDHDRAASTAVTLALAHHAEGDALPWSAMDVLADDLKSSAVMNFCDRLPSMGAASRTPMLHLLIEALSMQGAFAPECQQLRSLALELGDEP